jgi:hypothetical protein
VIMVMDASSLWSHRGIMLPCPGIVNAASRAIVVIAALPNALNLCAQWPGEL